jgi:DNA polymerase V
MGIDTVLTCRYGYPFHPEAFNVVLERTVGAARRAMPWAEVRAGKAGNRVQPFFGGRITEYHEMRQAICSYASRAAEKLRGEHQYCRFISAFVKTSPFALNEPYYGNSASVKLLTPTQDSRDIITAATKCLDAIWRDGHRYQKAGVMLGDFYSQGVAQLNLFDDNAPRQNSEKLMEVLDHLNAKDGRGTLYFAGQGIQTAWQMKRDTRRAIRRGFLIYLRSDSKKNLPKAEYLFP